MISAIVVAHAESEMVIAKTVTSEDAPMLTKLFEKRMVEIVSS